MEGGTEGYTFHYTLNGVPEAIEDGRFYSLHYNAAQHISSEGHPFKLLGRTSKLDIGGPFDSKRVEVHLGKGCSPWTSKSPFGANRYATFLPLPASYVHDAVRWLNDRYAITDNPIDIQTKIGSYCSPFSSSNDLDTWGTRVISSVVPTNPVADVAVSLGELYSERKFFSLPGTSGSLPGEYLNYMFGVSPTIGLAQDLRKAIGQQEMLLDNLHRNSGRLVRRQYRPDAVVNTVTTVFPNEQLSYVGDVTGLLAAYFAFSGPITRIVKTTTQWQFSGAFTYYIPESGIGRKIADLDYLYGVRATASLAWELLPYSWLVDYKASVGAAIKNLESFHQDGLVMPYAYVTKREVVESRYTWEGLVYNSFGVLERLNCEATVVGTTLQRRPATPFGFGITPGDLTLKQLSIIAALGLSRVL